MILYYPPRSDAKQLITTLHDLGFPVKMLTGDALAVVRKIAQGGSLPNIQRAADLKATSAISSGCIGISEDLFWSNIRAPQQRSYMITWANMTSVLCC